LEITGRDWQEKETVVIFRNRARDLGVTGKIIPKSDEAFNRIYHCQDKIHQKKFSKTF
jgi:hypothetical protein